MATISTVSSRNLYSLFNWGGFSGHECFSRMYWPCSTAQHKVLGGKEGGSSAAVSLPYPDLSWQSGDQSSDLPVTSPLLGILQHCPSRLNCIQFNAPVILQVWIQLMEFFLQYVFCPSQFYYNIDGSSAFLKASLDNLSVTCVRMFFERSSFSAKKQSEISWKQMGSSNSQTTVCDWWKVSLLCLDLWKNAILIKMFL